MKSSIIKLHTDVKESVIMKNVAYYNGRIAPLEELMIPANDRAVYFGDGVYDATYAVGRVIFAVDEHIERFMNSCRMLMIDPQITREELKKTLYMLVDLADDDDTCIYWQLRRRINWCRQNVVTKQRRSIGITSRSE